MMKPQTALILVDVQNDFCPGGSLAVADGDKVVLPLNEMVKHARTEGWLILVSRDWHPEKTTHFKQFGGIWPPHCVQGTPGAEFHQDLDVGGAVIISKGMGADENSYSAFEGITENDAQPPDSYLHDFGIKTVIVGGLATDYCVKNTAIDAAKAGFKVKLLRDASRAVNVNPGDGDKAIKEMEQHGIEITTTTNLLGALAA